MNIYAVIVTYNAMHRNWADKCLLSLERSTVPVTTIVVDNASNDGTRDYIPQHFPNVVWLPQEKNLGFGQANNVGIRYALEHEADGILLLNQDAVVQENAMEKMLAVNDGLSLLSPLHLNGDGTRIDEMFRISLRNSRNMMMDDLLIRNTLATSYESSEICAACWLMPAALLRKIGGFNPLFFHYSEDNNYYHRLLFHGVKTLLVPQARMCHDRLLQGNLAAFNRKHLRRDLMLVATNINNSFPRCVVRWLRVLYVCYKRDLPQHKYIVGSWSYEMCWLILHACQIAASRKAEKKEGLTWL